MARLVRICLPEGDAPAVERKIFRLLTTAGLPNAPRTSPRQTTEVFGGALGLDDADYCVPDDALGPYAGSPPDPAAGQRRQFARVAMALLYAAVDLDKLDAVADLLTWAVQHHRFPGELMDRRERAGNWRAQVVALVGVSVSTIGSWETGTAIPGRRDWLAGEAACGFSRDEVARLLDFTGPPERRGAPGAEGRRSSERASHHLLQCPPVCDCEVQARRATKDARTAGRGPRVARRDHPARRRNGNVDSGPRARPRGCPDAAPDPFLTDQRGKRPQRGVLGPISKPLAPTTVVEVDRKASKDGMVSLGQTPIALDPELIGKQVTLRFDGSLMHVIHAGLLVKTLPAPIPHQRRAKLTGA
ncbi:helix-turn-helix transcriptional regulator [Streptomyces roseoverticillatus]|uniref:helix-turn-helix domain-containing protein n=1 Tax=Streptomyces roseoverticillatus TaxID=66429 RepID=UPI0034036585